MNNGTMRFSPPQSIELNDREAEWFALVTESCYRDSPSDVADAMQSLVKSLIDRNAIPEVRLRLFDDADYAEIGGPSPKDDFESNGTRGANILRHSHFVRYLRHFVCGPDLPEAVVSGLCRILNEDQGTSGMVKDQYRRYARECVRKFGLERRGAATEFFRLGIEIGMEIDDARALRDAARSTR